MELMSDRWKKGSLHIPKLPDKVNIKGPTEAALQEYEVKQTQADRQPGSPSLQGTWGLQSDDSQRDKQAPG